MLKSFCTGALAGTIGFFGSRLTETDSIPLKATYAVGINALTTYTAYRHVARDRAPLESIPFAMGLMWMNMAGIACDYINLPSYTSTPFLLCVNLILNLAVNKLLNPTTEPVSQEMPEVETAHTHYQSL